MVPVVLEAGFAVEVQRHDVPPDDFQMDGANLMLPHLLHDKFQGLSSPAPPAMRFDQIESSINASRPRNSRL